MVVLLLLLLFFFFSFLLLLYDFCWYCDSDDYYWQDTMPVGSNPLSLPLGSILEEPILVHSNDFLVMERYVHGEDHT